MSDSPREPHKHTKMYDEMLLRLIGGAGELKKLIGEINELMRKYEISPTEMQRVVRFVSERHRWASYAIRQDGPEEPKIGWYDDADEADGIGL